MKFWRTFERWVLDELQGHHHLDSGKSCWNPGDGVLPNFAVEVKTSAKQLFVTSRIIEKIKKEAKHKGLDWMVVGGVEELGLVGIVVIAYDTCKHLRPNSGLMIETRSSMRIPVSLKHDISPMVLHHYPALKAVAMSLLTFKLLNRIS